MQLPLDKKNLTIQEAADVLNVRRERIWKMVSDGVFTVERSKLDGRQKLIPRTQVEAILIEEGYRPRRTARRQSEVPGPEIEGALDATSAPAEESDVPVYPTASPSWPKSIGMISDGSLSSSQSEEYMRQHLHVEPIEE